VDLVWLTQVKARTYMGEVTDWFLPMSDIQRVRLSAGRPAASRIGASNFMSKT
jgi:hypothetical protein